MDEQDFFRWMVLQREKRVPVARVRELDETVYLLIRDQKLACTQEGDLHVCILPDRLAGGPYEATLVRENGNLFDCVTYQDVWVGDVYLLSGQSNMELQLSVLRKKYEKEVKEDCFPAIRQFQIPVSVQFGQEAEDLDEGHWIGAQKEEKFKFSALGYFFARKLWQEERIPIGLILAAVPGAPIEAFLESGRQPEPKFARKIQELYASRETRESISMREQNELYKWHKELLNRDEGIRKSWMYAPGTEMDKVHLPGVIGEEDLTRPGSIWLFKEVQGPFAEDASLYLGMLQEEDDTYWNGHLIGHTENEYASRCYTIPREIIHPGKNLLAVRLVSKSGRFRFVEEQDYEIVCGRVHIPLAGEWNLKEGFIGCEEPEKVTVFEYLPAGVYQAMLAPLKNMAFAGVLWYQGESNTASPQGYGAKMISLIQNIRKLAGDADLPFCYVKIADYINPFEPEAFDSLKYLQMEQEKIAKMELKNVCMIRQQNFSEEYDLHPENKQTVGEDLAHGLRCIKEKSKI